MDVEIRVKSSKKFEDVCSALPEKVKENGFGVLAEIKTSEILKSKGFEYSPLRTYEVCNPSYASEILNINGRFESMLPCRIVVKGVEGGSEIVGLLPEAMASLVGDDKANNTMLKVQGIIKKIVKELAE